MKRQFLSLMLFALVFALMPSRLFAAADLNAGVLTVTGIAGDEEIQLQVGPTPGEVTVLKAPGVVDGTIFTGVHHIIVDNGPGASDTVEIKAELTSDLAITIKTDRGNDAIKLETRALAGSVNARVDVVGIAGLNTVEWLVYSAAQDLGLTFTNNSITGIDNLILKVESETPSQRLAVNLAANTGLSDDNIEAMIKSAAAVVDLDVAVADENGYDKFKLELDQLTAGQITADFNIDMGHLNDSAEIVLKGSQATSVVNGWISGGPFHDSLILFVEGTATGSPVLNGDHGQDSCTASLGTLVACE
jgi:hypothetical protein